MAAKLLLIARAARPIVTPARVRWWGARTAEAVGLALAWLVLFAL